MLYLKLVELGTSIAKKKNCTSAGDKLSGSEKVKLVEFVDHGEIYLTMT